MRTADPDLTKGCRANQPLNGRSALAIPARHSGIPPARAGQFPQPINDKAGADADELAAKDTKPKGFAS